jgi:hypothetical protein
MMRKSPETTLLVVPLVTALTPKDCNFGISSYNVLGVEAETAFK